MLAVVAQGQAVDRVRQRALADDRALQVPDGEALVAPGGQDALVAHKGDRPRTQRWCSQDAPGLCGGYFEVPRADRLVGADRDGPLAVRREGHARYDAGVPLE